MAKAMTKTQLVARMAEETGSDKKSAAATLNALGEIIRREVAAGGAVTIPNIGKISCRERPARTVRNPATGEAIEKEADRVIRATIAKPLKEQVNL